MSKNKNTKLYRNELIEAALQTASVRELAAKADVSNDTVMTAKRGGNVTIKTLRAIATGIGIPVCELVGCEGKIVAEQ